MSCEAESDDGCASAKLATVPQPHGVHSTISKDVFGRSRLVRAGSVFVRGVGLLQNV